MRVEAMNFRTRLISQLRHEEGEVLHAYKDHLGFWTIGVGRLIDGRKGGGISAVESALLLSNDIAKIESELDLRIPWWRQLGDARRAVIVNMAFQLGLDGMMKFRSTLPAVRDQHYEHAAALMLQSLWAKQTPARARRMARQMETDEWQS